MKISEIMSHTLETVPPEATLKEAAEKMKQYNVGCLPVREGRKLVGIVTDRDIVVRALADGRDPKRTPVREVMSTEVVTCFEDQELGTAAELMEKKHIRRLPVVDEKEKPVGILSLGDLAVQSHDHELAGEVLEKVSVQN
jgi:CBS domain-containing protein